MTTYKLTLRTLAPIHIGSGETLREDFDFTIHEKKTWRLNEDEVLKAKENVWRMARGGNYAPPGKMLAPADYQNPDLFRYVLRGVPRSAKSYAELKEFIKDVYDCPYIPGSSLKGALRTALAWTGWQEINPHLDRNAIGRNKSWAGQPLEHKLFGDNPNHDLLRALHVSDLHGSQKAGAGLIVVNANVFTLRKTGSPIELEALPGEIEFSGSLKIDESLFTAEAEKKLGFNNRRHWLDELMARAQAHSKARIDELAEWFGKADGMEKIASFYNRMAGAAVGNNQALVQIGWGAGWDGKTFWTHIQKDKALFEQIVGDFRMHKSSKDSPPRKIGDAFPRSKRVVIKNAVAAAPFGWALIEVNPKIKIIQKSEA